MPLVEDAAEALGATWTGRAAGSFGACGVFSFNGNKIVTSSGGGMLVSDDEALIDARTQPREPGPRAGVPHYEHVELGFNYRMSNLCAALGRGQLHGLDRKISRRRTVFDRYRAALGELPGVAFMPEAAGGRATRWLTVLTVDADEAGVDSETIRRHLDERGIEARPAWKPMHLQPVFAGAEMHGGAVCERIFRDGLCLPSGSGLTDADIDSVIARDPRRGAGDSGTPVDEERSLVRGERDSRCAGIVEPPRRGRRPATPDRRRGPAPVWHRD